MNYRKNLLLLVAISAIVRLLAAGMLEFGNDEVYYYTYALHLQSNYFDHPPGVALLIKLFTANLHFTGELFVRLGAIVFAAIGTLLSFAIGKKLKNENTGWIAALLYNASIYASVIAGTFILPDSPQIVFWLWCLLLLISIIRNHQKGASVTRQWLLFGIVSGVCIMCKIHGAFLWIGAGLYILLYERSMLKQPALYIAVLLTAAIISPIYFWNAANDFITWKYHSERVEVHQFSVDTDGFIQTLSGQLFYNNPFNVVLIIVAAVMWRSRIFMNRSDYRLLAMCGWPLIVFTTGMSLFRSTLPHWSGPGFVTLAFAAAAFVDDAMERGRNRRMQFFVKGGVILIAVVMIAGTAFINYWPGTTGHTNREKYGDGDFTLDMYGWKALGKEFTNWQKDTSINGKKASALTIVSNKWFNAAHLDYYVALPVQKHVVGVGRLEDLHQYAWLNTWRGAIKKGEDALCIIPSNDDEPVDKGCGQYFEQSRLVKTFTTLRNGKTARYFYVYLLTNFKGNDELYGHSFH